MANSNAPKPLTEYIGTSQTGANNSVIQRTQDFVIGERIESLGVGVDASGRPGEILATGNITGYFSDDRLKDKLGMIENALDKVDALSGFYYQANQTAQDFGYGVYREVGVSAQEVQAVLPEAVAPAPIDPEYLTVRYERIVPLLIEAIKELRIEINDLKSGK